MSSSSDSGLILDDADDSSSYSWPPISSSATPEEGEEEGEEETAPAASTNKLLLTVDDVIQEVGFGRFQFLVFLFCSAFWFCAGVCISVSAVFIPTLQCEWKLSDTEVALVPFVFSVGAQLNSILLFLIGDRIGRKKILLISLLLQVVFGVLAGIPVSHQKTVGYPWLLACRFVLGMAYAIAVNLIVVFLCEFLPVKARGPASFALEIFFALGYSVNALEGLLLIGAVGWQWYSAIAVATPALVTLLLLIFAPETPRYLFVSGQKKQAQALLIKMATVNRRDIVNRIAVSTELDLKDSVHMHNQNTVSLQQEYLQNRMSVTTELELKELVEKENNVSPRRKLLNLLEKFRSIFSKDLRRSTFLLCFLWLCVAFVYNGGTWLPTALLQDEGSICGLGNDTRPLNSTLSMDLTLNSNNTLRDSTDSHSSCATVIDNGFYLKIAWTAFGEVPGIIVSGILIEVIGRRMIIAFSTFGAALSIVPLFYCGLAEFLDGYLVTLLLFLFRGFQIVAFTTLILYSSEVYPTRLRGTVIGLFGMFQFPGMLSSTFSALALINFNYNAGVGLYAGMCLLATVAAVLLPIETKGKPLKDH